MKLLLHCCCAPCATAVADYFRSLQYEVTGWFFNPNIHPEEERLRREGVLSEGAPQMGLALLPAGPGISLTDFLLCLSQSTGRRCRACYKLRLTETARHAAKHGFRAFSSTLLISPYQDVSAIAEVGANAAEQFGVEFRSPDLRHKYPESCQRSRELGLYRQNYCGCLFSQLERGERRSNRFVSKLLKRSPADMDRTTAGR